MGRTDSAVIETWQQGVKRAREIFDDNLATLLVDYPGMFAGIQGDTINVGESKEDLYKAIDPTKPHLVIAIEENPPETVDVFTRVAQRRELMDKLCYLAGKLQDDNIRQIISFVEKTFYKEKK